MNDRPVAILVTGPRYLFAVTGLYYLWELLKTHRVVLVVMPGTGNDPLYQRVAGLKGVIQILELPNEHEPRLAVHARYRAIAVDLIGRLSPDLLVQHNFVYPWNRYLAEEAAARLPNCRKIGYLNSFGGTIVDDCRSVIASHVSRVCQERQTTRLQAELMLRHNCDLGIIFESFIYPKIVSGSCQTPNVNQFTGDIFTPNSSQGLDDFFLYSAAERDATFGEWPGLAPVIKIIRHPVEVVGDEVHAAFDLPKAEAQIVVLPGCEGYILERVLSVPEHQVIREAADHWAAALGIIARSYPGHKIVWKFHPAFARTPLQAALTGEISRQLPGIDFAVIDQQENAQSLILQSKVVVSESSGVLWWASLLGDKTVISLDIFGANLSLFKACDGVRYFASLQALAEADLGPDAVAKRQEARRALPTFTAAVGV